MGRNTQGVRLVNLAAGRGRAAARRGRGVTRVVSEDDDVPAVAGANGANGANGGEAPEPPEESEEPAGD